MSKANEMIEAEGISKVYWDATKSLQVLENISLTIGRGETVAVLGPSGSGKTTLLNILSGLDEPSTGTVRIDGQDLKSLSQKQRSALRNEKIGFVFQFYHLLPEFTALENTLIPCWISGKGEREERSRARAMALLDRLGVAGRAAHYPSELSGGEQQRVAIARALVNEPAILFCDEPTGNLDPKTAKEVSSLLQDLTTGGNRTVVMVTHDAAVASAAGRIWSMASGQWVSREWIGV